jgi:hypothetical protein
MRRNVVIFIFLVAFAFGCSSKGLREAETLIAQKQYERAEGVLELETKASPKGAQGFFLLGKVRLLLGKPEAAKEAFDLALPLDGTLKDAIGPTYLACARALYETNKAQVAPQIRLYIAQARKYSSSLSAGDSEWMKTVERELVSPTEASSISMAHMRTLAIGIESYGVEHNAYPVSDDIEEIWRLLKSTVLTTAPEDTRMDGWGTPLKVHCTSQDYRIVSAGADRRFDEGGWSGPEHFGDPAEDIVFSNGKFTRTWILAHGR